MAALTDPEWNSLHPDFPNLVRAQTLKTGPATQSYNCIRFALGTPGLWINPPPALPNFILLFQAAGWNVCPFAEGQVDGWALANGTMTHGSRYTTDWESKIGRNIRISHVRQQLGDHPNPGSIYGDIVVSFKRHAFSTAETISTAVPTAGLTSEPSLGTDSGDNITVQTVHAIKIDRVVNTLNGSFSFADDFDAKYGAWKATWFSGPMENKQSSSDRAHGREWDALVLLTAKVLPQVVNKLKNQDDLFAVEIYNKLQTDTKKKVSPSDIQNYYYLDAQAKKIIQFYGSSVAAFDEQVASWIAHQNRVSLSSHSRDYIQHSSFDAIVAMGKDHVVPLIMVRYAEDQYGWWHELLHEVVYGKKSGADEFDKPKLYQQWKEWFEASGDAEAA